MNYKTDNLFTSIAVPPIPTYDEEDFDKWQKQVSETEQADSDRPSMPPEGEEEFTDDDGTTYKWDRGLRAWVPQVGSWFLQLLMLFLYFILLFVVVFLFMG